VVGFCFGAVVLIGIIRGAVFLMNLLGVRLNFVAVRGSGVFAFVLSLLFSLLFLEFTLTT